MFGAKFGSMAYAMLMTMGPKVFFQACPDGKEVVELEFLSVSKDYAKRGIGGNLVDTAIEVTKHDLVFLALSKK